MLHTIFRGKYLEESSVLDPEKVFEGYGRCGHVGLVILILRTNFPLETLRKRFGLLVYCWK